MTDDKKLDEPVEPDPIPVPEPVDMIGKANEAAERLERANETLGKLLARNEALQVEKTLGGSAEAGTPAVKVDPNASAKEFLKDTGYEDIFDEPVKK